MSKEPENDTGVERKSVPMLRIVFDPSTYRCVVDGSVPNLEFGRYMLTVALEQTEKQIAERDHPRIARPELVPDLSSVRGG